MLEKKEIQTVIQLLEFQAKNRENAVAVVGGESLETYGSLNEKAEKFAALLVHLGIEKGDCVVIKAANSIELIIAILGCLKAGAIFVLAHSKSTEKNLNYILKNSEAKMFISENKQSVWDSSVLCITLSEIEANDFNSRNERYKIVSSSADIATIIYTSGSTGVPKGIVESNDSILFAVGAINQVIQNTENDRILCGLPLSFDYGLYQIFLSFDVGATLVIYKDFSNPLLLPSLLQRYGITGLPLVPTIVNVLVKSRLLERIILPDLRYITSTGDILYSDIIEKLQGQLPQVQVYPMYGLTECKRVSILRPEEYNAHKASVGKPLPGTTVYIADEKGNRLPAGKMGELIVVGPHVMRGYWKDNNLTNLRFFTDSTSGMRALHTHDTFVMDEEGFLYFIARSELLIKSGGYRIGTGEIEYAISQIEGVDEVYAVGIEDANKGQSICIVVSTSETNITEKQIINEFYNNFINDIVLKYIFIFTESFPKTPNGKTDRQKLERIVKKKIELKRNERRKMES